MSTSENPSASAPHPLLLICVSSASIILLVTGIAKIIDSTEVLSGLAEARILPAWSHRPLAAILPWSEVVCGLLIAWPRWRAAGAVLTCVLGLGMAAYAGIAMAVGASARCGCAGDLLRGLAVPWSAHLLLCLWLCVCGFIIWYGARHSSRPMTVA